MKLRLHNNSVRMRLNQSEVTRLAAGERIEQVTCFSPTTRLISSIESATALSDVQVTFNGSRIAFRLPGFRVTQWADSDEVSIEATHQIDEMRSIQILIEKDFKCLHTHSAEDEDAFPNPRACPTSS